MSQSPLPQKMNAQVIMNFYDALKLVVEENKKATKLEWNNPNIYIQIHEERLKILTDDGKLHDFILRDADIIGTDWIIV